MLLAAALASRDARLALAREALWRGEYAAAAARFAELLRENPRDVEARVGAAQAAYATLRFAAYDPQLRYAASALTQTYTLSVGQVAALTFQLRFNAAPARHRAARH